MMEVEEYSSSLKWSRMSIVIFY